MRSTSSTIIILTFSLLGAGCPLSQSLVSPRIAEPVDEVFTERPIPQLQGFGDLPKIPASPFKPGVTGSVRITTELPSLPSNIAVLRVKSGRPNDNQLRNIAASMQIPGGSIGADPDSRELKLEWRDDRGFLWSYDGSPRRLSFVQESTAPTTLTVSAWPERTQLLEKVRTFLVERGANLKRLGNPYIEPDWAAWWQEEQAQAKCMNRQILEFVRSASAASLDQQVVFPVLPLLKDTTCVQPEFPSRIRVRLNATQDGQSIFNERGSPVYGAEIVVDAASGEILSGFFLTHIDPDRSDYPAISLDEARRKLAQGGLGGTPTGEVVVNEISFEWFTLDDKRDPVTTYLLPAWVGVGTIRYPDGRTAPYRIVVPLIKVGS